MNALQQYDLLSKEQMEITFQSNDCTVSRYEDERGSLVKTRHTVFPGITLLYKDFHRSGSTIQVDSPGPNILVIEHCLEGRVEFQMNDESFYLTAGDVVIRRTNGAPRRIHFPAEVYRGINIHIDLKKTPRCLACILADVDVEPITLIKKFGLEDNSFHFLRRNEHLAHIFREFYSIPESVQKGYLKVKILEILLFLSGMELPEYDVPKRRLTKTQIRIDEDAHTYLAEHRNKHITIAELARHFGTSQTQLKDSFRLVYGTTVQNFICEQKMRSAAVMLKEADRKIADVAAEFGYANASKFSTAFQRIHGKTPAQYRMVME